MSAVDVINKVRDKVIELKKELEAMSSVEERSLFLQLYTTTLRCHHDEICEDINRKKPS